MWQVKGWETGQAGAQAGGGGPGGQALAKGFEWMGNGTNDGGRCDRRLFQRSASSRNPESSSGKVVGLDGVGGCSRAGERSLRDIE